MSLTKQQKEIEFEKIWARYPNKDSKKKSCQIFMKTIKTYKDLSDLNTALNNYLTMLKSEIWRKPKSGSTFFNNYTDWIDFTNKSVHDPAVPFTIPTPPEKIKQIKYSFTNECQRKIQARLKAAWLMRPVL